MLFVVTTGIYLYIYDISSSENVAKRDAIFTPVPKQFSTKVGQSYESQSNEQKIALSPLIFVNTNYR